ncbi:MAG: YicC family protein, partial [Clostridiales bacterium]|nr:YicC family protein [Clostridiales bacterium]
MTGYGRGEALLNGRSITVEVRAVNNRYFDCSVKIPRLYIFAEEAIKTRVKSAISRGKADVFVTMDSTGMDRVSVTVNQPVADSYYAALCALGDAYGLQDNLTVGLLSKFPDVLLVKKEQDDAERVADDICTVLDMALEEFNHMREQEGGRLVQDIRARGEAIKRLVSVVEERSPQVVSEYQAKMEQRMADLLKNTQIDEGRILTEAAIFADKTAVDEETVRLRSHLDQMADMLAHGGAIGRKMDFLIQEFN